jgi:DNA (cytosine-5)-methyltransferase 1
MRSSDRNRKKLAIDLFCGCGGLSCGLQMAGFDIIAGLDINSKYTSTFRTNFPGAKLLSEDVSELAPQTLAKITGLKPGQLSLLAGGPPCQGFSKNVPRRHRFLADPRNLLMKRFLDYCEYLEPEYVIIENVAEMKNGFEQAYSAEIEERLGEAGYAFRSEVFNAADYGVPQRRRRAFFVARRGSEPPRLPAKSHVPPSPELDAQLFRSDQHVCVWEAIGDLPSLEHTGALERWTYDGPPLSNYQKAIRNPLGYVTNHQCRALRPKQFARLAALAPGQGNKDLPAGLRVNGGYSGAYGRLTKEMICPTITRWVFHPGSGRWGHPVDTRLLSIREIARIQSFPDSFTFHGTYTDMAGQLGNAVPPFLARAIAESLTGRLLAESPAGGNRSCLAHR